MKAVEMERTLHDLIRFLARDKGISEAEMIEQWAMGHLAKEFHKPIGGEE